MRVARADRVDEDTDFNPAMGHIRERVEKLSARRVVVEDVGEKHDALLGAPNGLEHGRLGLVAIHERLDEISAEQRPRGHVADKMSKLHRLVGSPQDRRDIPRDKADRGERALRVFFVLPAKRHRPPPDAIDTNQVVENRAKERHEENETHPTDRRADFHP